MPWMPEGLLLPRNISEFMDIKYMEFRPEVFYCADWFTKQSIISRPDVTTSGFLSYRSKIVMHCQGRSWRNTSTWAQPAPCKVKRVWLTARTCGVSDELLKAVVTFVTLAAVPTCRRSLGAVFTSNSLGFWKFCRMSSWTHVFSLLNLLT